MTIARPYSDFIAEARADERDLVIVDREGPRATVTMNDPDRLNTLSAPMTIQLHEALRELVADTDVRVVVLTGTDPAFSSGGDLRLMQGFAHPVTEDREEGTPVIWRWIRDEFGGVAKTIARSDTAFIAAVNGPAAGVGLAFALACDLILCSDRAVIVPAFGKIGLLPEVGNSWLLTRRLGYQRAFELFARGRHLTGEEFTEMGVANAWFPHDDLMEEAGAWAGRLERLPDHVLRMMKPLLRQAADMTWEQAIALEEFAEPSAFTTRAHRDGVATLLDGTLAG